MSIGPIGPRDPFTVVGDVEIIHQDENGTTVRAQDYADGRLYQLTAPVGAAFVDKLPAGEWMNAWEEDGHLNVGVWVAA